MQKSQNRILVVKISPLTHPDRGDFMFSVRFRHNVRDAAAAATAMTFASHVKTVRAKPYIFGTKKAYFWKNVLDDLSWPWLNVTAVGLINKNLLVCTIKCEPLIQSLQNLFAIYSSIVFIT